MRDRDKLQLRVSQFSSKFFFLASFFGDDAENWAVRKNAFARNFLGSKIRQFEAISFSLGVCVFGQGPENNGLRRMKTNYIQSTSDILTLS